MTDALTPVLVDEERRTALLQAIGFDRLSPSQRELALSIAQRYELDPMLKHLVMIDGRPYITRDGLLHVAHRSNDFDGMSVDDAVLDAEPGPDGKRYWRSRAHVWRRSYSRPFEYPGRYPADGQNRKYAEEMAIKVAEVMTLRRAFDVSAATLEERWDAPEHLEVDDDHAQPTSLADRVAQRVEAIVVEDPSDDVPDPQGSTQPPEAPAVVSIVEPEPDEAQPTSDTVPDDATFDAFVEWARADGRDAEVVKSTAQSLFPDSKGFKSLTTQQLDMVRREVEALEAATTGDATPEAYDDSVSDALARGVDAMTSDPPAPKPFVKPVMCEAPSPLSPNGKCTLDVGHRGVHRAGLKEAW